MVRIQRSRLIVFLTAVAACLGAACGASIARRSDADKSSASGGAKDASGCNRYAGPWGSDRSGKGDIHRPYQSLTRLDRALRPGQTGCLLSGTYGGIHTRHRLSRSGARRARITIEPAPGQTVTVVGWVDLGGSYTTLSHLTIDGSNTLYTGKPGGPGCATNVSQPLDITGRGDTLEYNDYFQSVPTLRGNGIGIGFWGDADNTVIRFNRIHDVGSCMAYDHLIYASHGNNIQIYDNWLWNDPHGRGVQLYPAPTNARVWSNVIDHAGVGFNIGDERGTIASGNRIFDNVVINSLGLPWENLQGVAINVWWGGKPGRGNSFSTNDSYDNPGGIGSTPRVRARGNISVDPLFVDPTNHIYLTQNTQLQRDFGLPGP